MKSFLCWNCGDDLLIIAANVFFPSVSSSEAHTLHHIFYNGYLKTFFYTLMIFFRFYAYDIWRKLDKVKAIFVDIGENLYKLAEYHLKYLVVALEIRLTI